MYCGNDTDDVAIVPEVQQEPNIDLRASGLTVTKDGKVSFSYEITTSGSTVPASTAELYWISANGNLIGTPLYSVNMSTVNGRHGPIHAAGVDLENRPNNAAKLALVLDGKNVVAEKSEGNNRIEALPEDPDDQIVEAKPVASGVLTQPVSLTGNLHYMDVDMYSFTVQTRQKIAFDYDSSNLHGVLRIFDSSGREISEGNGLWIKNGEGTRIRNGLSTPGAADTLREDAPSVTGLLWRQSYLEVTFAQAGTYYIGVSGENNQRYNAMTGDGDSASPTKDLGNNSYQLVVTPITQPPTSVAGQAVIRGTVYMPNGPLTSILVSLSSNNGSVIQGNRTTWVTIHGRASSPQKLATVSGNLRNSTGDQVLQLDWSPGAADNSPALTGLQGAEWIPYVADWASSTLRAIGLVGSQVQLVGHSWGSYVAQRIGAVERLGTVNSIVALDPARMGKALCANMT
jgi:hypothetical protein